MMKAAAIAAMTLALASAASAQGLRNENLIVSAPKGYHIAHQQKAQRGLITEMVPQGQSAENWTEMVTVQIFFGLGKVTPDDYRQRMQTLWNNACQGSTFSTVKSGTENGYATLMLRLNCPTNSKTGKPEYTWMKFVQGNDSFYVVQKAFKYEPSETEIVQWTSYLDRVSACDSRLPDRPCRMPQPNPPK